MGKCSSGGCGTAKTDSGEVSGCGNNGSCGTSGCNRMNVFDWLTQMDLPAEMVFDVVEVKFKGGRKEFFRNAKRLELNTGDYVIVDAGKGWHIGTVSLQGELVRLQMKKYRVKNTPDLPEIFRIADERDMGKFEQSKNRELVTLYRTREIIKELNLQMKLSDVEFQADNTKATFFYSADTRVDFRELIKILASEFRIRVEMRQISIRQEAGRVGGIGACGRELCCSTWLTEFKSVSTSAARYQSLSLNPAKLSGQCGRLKCCLNYELETYLDALKDIPKIEENIITAEGQAKLQKTDIFRKLMWFGYDTENNWYGIPAEEVVKMIEQNKKGIILPPLSEEFWRKDAKNQTAASASNAPVSSNTAKTDDFQITLPDKEHKKRRRSRKNKTENKTEDNLNIPLTTQKVKSDVQSNKSAIPSEKPPIQNVRQNKAILPKNIARKPAAEESKPVAPEQIKVVKSPENAGEGSETSKTVRSRRRPPRRRKGNDKKGAE